MIPLAKILELRKKRSAAVACDAADDEICTAEDPSKCRVHGIRRYEREGDYLDKLAHASEEQKKAEAIVNYFQNLDNSKSMEEVDKEIASYFYDVFQNEEEVDKNKRLSSGQKAILKEVYSSRMDSESLSNAETIKAKRCLAATLKHLREQHGVKITEKCALVLGRLQDKDLLNAYFCGGTAEDENNGVLVFSTNHKVKNENTYHHGDYRDDFDYCRHELAHILEHQNGIGEGEFEEYLSSAIGKDNADREVRGVSDYAATYNGEAEAECFAMFTSNDYEGQLSESTERFIKERMIGDEK